MDILQEVRDISKKSFLGHVFSTTDEGKAEILNVVRAHPHHLRGTERKPRARGSSKLE